MRTTNTMKALEIDYPQSDGKPMAESDLHRDWMIQIILKLQNRYAGQQVYVSGNLLIYYEEGNPRKSVAPDAFVVKGLNPRRRRVYKLWEEKKPPHFILETTSKTTRREDLGKKRELYKQLRVPEFFLFDPLGEWLDPPLQGYRLVDGDYQRIVPGAEGGVLSQELGIRFVLRDGDLLMFDAATGELVMTKDEQMALAAAQNYEEQKRRAEEAEQQVKQLQEELARLREPGKKPNGHKGKNGKNS